MKDIRPTNNNGSIRIRFRLAGRRYGFNPVPGGSYKNTRDLKTAQAIATRIANDILAGSFDPSLDRYRLTPRVAPRAVPKDVISLRDTWVLSLGLSEGILAGEYHKVRRMLEKAAPRLGDTVWLTGSGLAPGTFNKRLSLIRKCYRWAVSEGILDGSPWDAIAHRNIPKEDIKPFTVEETRKILEGFKGSPYGPFVLFLFLTGCRLSEAIGLTWEAVDLEAGTVTVKEVLAVDPTGNGHRRIRKGTKTGTVRVLSGEALTGLLSGLPKGNPGDLVFRSPRGCIISDTNFRARYWGPVLRSQGIPYRRPHVIRHSLASHAIARGMSLLEVSYLLGHKDTTMVIRTYGHLIGRPDLPDLGI